MISRLCILVVSLSLMVLAWPLIAPVQTAAANDWQDFDLLAGRLVMSAPSAAKFDDVGAEDIMAASPADTSVAQLRIQAAGTEIVVHVRELFALFPREPTTFFFDAIWGGETPQGADKPERIQVAEPLTAYGVATGTYLHSSGNNVLASLLVAQADGTAQYVYIMTWDVDAATLEQASRIAERMVLSLRPGPRQDLQGSGRHILATLPQDGGAPLALVLDLPAGYTVSKEQGPDFSAYQVGKLSPLDAPSGRLGLYVGHFPRYHYERMGVAAGGLRKVPGSILANSAEWLERHAPAGSAGSGWTHRELIVPLEASAAGLKLHLFLAAPDDNEELTDLTKVAEEGLRLTPP
jgi:hypothetical protein